MAANRLKLCNFVLLIATLVLAVQQQQQHSGATFQLVANCDCNSTGSISTDQCDRLNGQCQCKNQNITGLRCDKCRENHYDLSGGCPECPSCYRIVHTGVNIHELGLERLIALVDEMENNPNLITDAKFRTQLLDLVARVNQLLADANNAQGRESILFVKLGSLQDRLNQFELHRGLIEAHLKSSRPFLDGAAANVTIAEGLLEQIRAEAKKARDHIEIEGSFAVKNANDRVIRLGQQSIRMTNLANESRQLADEHERQAARIKQLYEEAMNYTKTASEMAQNASIAQEENAKNIRKLKQEIDRVDMLLMNTSANAQAALIAADSSHKEALALYTQVYNLQLNDAEVAKLKQQAADILKMAMKLKEDVEAFMEKHEKLINSTQFKLNEMKALLAEAIRQQGIADAQLADIDKNIQKARDAINRGNKILEEAQGMLDKLHHFDAIVKNSKEKAAQAVKKIPEIRVIIKTAESKTKDARAKLGSALQDATAALNLAQEAHRFANETSVYLKSLHDRAQYYKEQISTLKVDAVKLASDIKETSDRMDQYEQTAEMDAKLAIQVLGNANKASSSAKNATATADYLLGVLNALLKSIDKIEGIDVNKLGALEEQLAKVKVEITESNLPAITDDLIAQREKQKELMAYYHDLIEWLKKEVANIRAVRDSLPDKCFKRNRLEVPIHEN